MKKQLFEDDKGIHGINAKEHELIDELAGVHRVKCKRILNEYFDSFEPAERQIAFERLDEIFTFYLHPGYGVLTPFTFNSGGLDTIFELMEELRPTIISPVNQLSNRALLFKSFFSDERGWKYIIDVLSKEPRWFDTAGEFVRKGRGKGIDNPGATCDLFNFLNAHQYTNIPRESFAEYSMRCFNVSVGKRSSRIGHHGKPYKELEKRVQHARSILK